ncbi:MAG: hypothetical protein ABIP38_04725 [Steroidobacteraceae bacterium]
MKRLIISAAIAAIATLSYVATSADGADRPAGVSAKEWVSISPALGIVLIPNGAPTVGRVDPSTKQMQSPPGGMPLLLKPPVNGYFMVKGASGWSRLVVVEPIKGPADVG